MAKAKWKSKGTILERYRPQAQLAVHRALLVGEGVTKANTPVRKSTSKIRGGTARRSVHIEPGTDTGTRVSGQLGSNVLYFKWIEIGSRGRPGKYPLAKGVEAAKAALSQELKAIR